MPYAVQPGDTLTSLAKKFNTTRKKLKSLNDLATTKLKPGQVLQVPAHKSAKPTAVAASAKGAKTPKEKPHHDYLVAQPVQDFDIPASTFASCPVPVPSDEDTETPAPVPAQEPLAKASKPAPSPAPASPEVATESASPNTGTTPSAGPEPKTEVATKFSAASPKHPAETTAPQSTTGTSLASKPATLPSPTTLPPASHNPFPFFSSIFGKPAAPAANDWGNRFLQQARLLGDKGIEYDDDWRPPGESRAWAMDCSNTARYLYKVTAGIQLPRTASDQYYYLHLQGKAWDVPQNSAGFADGDFLRRNLHPGDLLFWENTYRPERQPPITHVMVFLGTNEKGQWLMAGSQSSRGGEHNRRNGGPDVYVFRPSQPCGGYTTWLGLVHHQGRFCAFGRPLEADPAKLAMAAND